MNIAVCDTSSLVRLGKGGVIYCLKGLFDKIYIPKAVENECVDPVVSQEILDPFFEIHEVKHLLQIGMGPGEREVISLAIEKGIETIIIDDEKAFLKSMRYGLFPVRTTNILLAAKHMKIIPAVFPVLGLMRLNGEGIDDDVYFDVLKKANEVGFPLSS